MNNNFEDFNDKSLEEIEREIFNDNPKLYSEIAKSRGKGIPKKYKKYVEKFDVDKRLFLFESNLGKQYTGNPRYIYEKMIEKYPNFKYVWAYNGNEDHISGDAIVVKRRSKKYYKYLAKAGVVINNTVFPVWFLREETFYLQTWHGTPYKRLHWDRDGTCRHTNPEFFSKSTSWNCLLSPNHYSTLKFKSAFKYDGEILESGYPANDIFYNQKRYNSKRSEVRKKLNIKPNAKVYLYAPTWRDGGHIGNQMFKFDLLLDPNEFIKKAPENSILLIRTHHMSDEGDLLKDFQDKIIDVSMWDDAIELMCASDVLISDYSSIIFDWYCSKKPVIYYVPDLEKYENQLRGTYFDIRKTNCGTICKTEEELYNSLDIKNNKFHETFYDTFCSLHDGNSTDRVIEHILNENNLIPKSSKKNMIKKILNKISPYKFR